MAPKKGERITKAELARLAGKTRQAVGAQMKRHGVKTHKDGTVNKAEALAAMAVGASLDKSKAQAEMAALESRPGAQQDSLVYRSKMAGLRRIVLQGDLLEIERDKARGDLIPLSDHKSQLLDMQNVCVRLWEIWIEAVGAKRKDAALMDELRHGRDQVLAETTAIMEG